MAGCSKVVRCEDAKKAKVRNISGIHKQFGFVSLTTQIAIFQQPARREKPIKPVLPCVHREVYRVSFAAFKL